MRAAGRVARIKTIDQQQILLLHRLREHYKHTRVARINLVSAAQLETQVKGLDREEAARRLRELGPPPDTSSRSTASIVAGNVFTLFNAIIGVFFIFILSLGLFADAIFGLIAAVNSYIGIRQELKAKETLDELAVLVSPRAQVYRDGDRPEAVPDYLILCVKVLPGVDRAELVRPWMGARTCLVLIENGLDIERELAEAYPDNPVISCLAFIAASRTGPGVVEHKAYGKLVMGRYPEGIDDHCRELSQLFIDGGINIDLTEEVVGERWRKCLYADPLVAHAGPS